MSDPRDVLFVVLDSARKDRLSTYGHTRATTPTLDALAERSTVFENAYTPAPWTLPSHCSMFTGLFPSEHGITNGFTDGNLRLPDAVDTVAERLADDGYRTAGFSNNPWVGQLSGLNRGFDEYVEWNLEVSASNDAPIHTSADRFYDRVHSLLGHFARQPVYLLKRRFFTSNLVERASRWLEHTADDPAPTFTFLNLMEAHSPYFPPKDAFRELELDPPNRIEPRMLNTRLLAYVLGETDLDADRRERVLEYYDASVRYEDRKLARLLDSVANLDDVLLVVCSDHGKTLGEFDRDRTPPHYARDININVPLLVKWPGQADRRTVEAPVELTDLFEVLQSGDDARSSFESGVDYALTEDYLPHTGRQTEEVTRWRTLSGEEHKYVRSEDAEEFVLGGTSEDERVLQDSEVPRERLREAMSNRTAGLRGVSSQTTGESQSLGSDVEGQLEDLGYLR